MPKLPAVTGKRLLKILGKLGYVLDHVHGSHYIMRDAAGRKTTIPVHGSSEIPKGTLSGILSDLDITREEFMKLLQK